MKKVKEFQSGLVSKALVQHTRAEDSNPTKVLDYFFISQISFLSKHACSELTICFPKVH